MARPNDPRPASEAASSFPSGPGSRPPAGRDLEQLSQNLRRLALQLVQNEATAEDVVQEAWLAALDEPPDRIRNLNAWMRRVVRNLAARTVNKSRRRREVEVLSAAQDTAEDEDRLVEHLSVMRLLREATGALREPYKSTLEMRFFEDLSVEEVAARVGHSPATVRSQLSRGLKLLRAELDRRHEGRRSAWSVALLGFLGLRRKGGGGVGLGGIAAWAGVLLLAPLAVWLVARGLRGERAAELEAVASVPAAESPAPEHGRSTAGTGRVPLAENAPDVELDPAAAGAPTPTAIPTRRLELRVERPDGAPPANMTVSLRGTFEVQREFEGASATVDVPERFLIGPPQIPAPHPGVKVRVCADDEAWSSLYNVPIPPEGRTLTLVSGGPAQELVGEVRDDSGSPVPDATVVRSGDRRGVLISPEGFPYGDPPESFRADAEGRFRIGRLPREAHTLAVHAPGFLSERRVLQAEGPVIEQQFVLSRGATMSGRVLLQDGEPATGARVWLPDPRAVALKYREIEAHADEQGRFELTGAPPGAVRVFAFLERDGEGHFAAETLTLEVSETPAVWNAQLTWSEPVQLLIEDAEKHPVPGAMVSLYVKNELPYWCEVRYADNEGLLTFPYAPEGELWVLVQQSPGHRRMGKYGPLNRSVVNIAAAPADEPAPGSARGVVLDWNGAPLERCRIVCTSGTMSFEVQADPEGRFLHAPLTNMRHSFLAFVEGHGAYLFAEEDCPPGNTVELGVHRLPQPLPVQLVWNQTQPTPTAPWTLQATLRSKVLKPRTVRVLEHPNEPLRLLPGEYRIVPAGTPNADGHYFVVPQSLPTSSTALQVNLGIVESR